MSLRRSFYNKNIDQVESQNMFDPEDKTQKHQKPKWKVIIACIFTVIISCSICSYLFYQNGYQSGNAQGYNTGFEAGKEEGYNEGYKIGKQDGDVQGWQRGYEFSKNENTKDNLTINQFSDWYDNYIKNNQTSSSVDENKCSVSGCSNSKKYGSDYCTSHGCFELGCYNRRANNLTMYCKEHKCAVSDCNSGTAYNSRYCYVHR